GLFLLVFGLITLTDGGGEHSTDGSQSFLTTEAILLRHTIEIDSIGRDMPVGRGGNRRYSKYHPGLAIAEIPFYVVLYAASSEMRGLAEKDREKMLRAWVPVLTNTTLTALLIVFFFQTLMTMGYGDKVSLGTTLFLTFTTPIWPYARYDFSEPLQ